MENIIAQIILKMIEEISKIIKNNGISNLVQSTNEATFVINEGVLEIFSTLIEEADLAVLNAKKERKIDGITVKQRNVPRTVTTLIGDLTYKRTYFKLKNGSMAYIIDQLIGVEPFERVTKEVCAKLVQNAASVSMQKAADMVGVSVSRQTVNNKVISMKNVAAEMKRVDITPSELHIFADEDHVHLRPKKSAMVPLVVVTEGIDTSDPKRHKTIDPAYFQGYGMDNRAFIENVVAGIYEKYDMDKVEKVYVHADGGNWIKALCDLLPNTDFVMDGFHLEKYLKKLFALPCANSYAGVIRKALQNNDFEAFEKYCNSINEKQDDTGKKKLNEVHKYFCNNWDAIINRVNGNSCGSCTEPLISHTLSERLSRNPLAWSKEGLGKMAMLRIYDKNGGKVTADDIRVSRSKADRTKDFNDLKNGFELYNSYAEKQIKTVLENKHDWSIFENNNAFDGITNGKITGTSVLLKSCACINSLIS